MITLYRGSRVLVEKPNISASRGERANGTGVYFTPDVSTAFTYLPVYKREIPNDQGQPFYDGSRGVIYETTLDQQFMEENFLNLDGHIDEKDLERFKKIAEDKSQDEITDWNINQIKIGRPRTDLVRALDLETREACETLAKHGILGTYKSDLVCFFREKDIPDYKISQVAGNFPQAHAAFERQKETGVLSVDQPVREDGSFAGPRKSYISDELNDAAGRIHKTRDRALIAAFEQMVDPLVTDETFTAGNGPGFNARDSIGIRTVRALNDDNLSSSADIRGSFDHALTFIAKDQADAIAKKAEAFQAELQRHRRERRADIT